MPNGQRVLEGFGFDRGWLDPQASALGLVRLANDSDYAHFRRVNQGLKRAAGQFRRSQKNGADCFHIRDLRPPAALEERIVIFRFCDAG